MKKIALFIALCGFSFAANSQTIAKKTADGNFVQVAAPAKTADQLVAGCEKSGAIFTDKEGGKHAVYLTAKGKMFYLAVSKTSGRTYRRYFKTAE